MEEKDEYDKVIISKRKNKDGHGIILKRKISNIEVIKDAGYYTNKSSYDVFLENEVPVGSIYATVCNYKEGDTAEIEYVADEKHRNKGNIGIALTEVLRDVFLSQSLDGFQIRPGGSISKIEKVFLSINSDNYPSMAVARKNSFIKSENHKNIFTITKEDFLKSLKTENNKSSQGVSAETTPCDRDNLE